MRRLLCCTQLRNLDGMRLACNAAASTQSGEAAGISPIGDVFKKVRGKIHETHPNRRGLALHSRIAAYIALWVGRNVIQSLHLPCS